MKKVEVFGTGCRKCVATEELIKTTAAGIGVDIDLRHISDPVEIASRGVLSTPAVVVDGTIVHRGGLPNENEIKLWLK